MTCDPYKKCERLDFNNKEHRTQAMKEAAKEANEEQRQLMQKPDYHQRFRERNQTTWFVGEGVLNDILYSVDEVVAEVDEEHNKCASELTNLADEMYVKGRKHERAALIEKVEGMKHKLDDTVEWPQGTHDENDGYNQALDDLLVHLRGEKRFVEVKVTAEGHDTGSLRIGPLPIQEDRCKHGVDGTDCFKCFPSQEETECCHKCWGHDGFRYECRKPSCTYCHKPRTEVVNPEESVVNQQDYSKKDHTHCWNQSYSHGTACGIPAEKHTQCCLCEEPRTEAPKELWSKSEMEIIADFAAKNKTNLGEVIANGRADSPITSEEKEELKAQCPTCGVHFAMLHDRDKKREAQMVMGSEITHHQAWEHGGLKEKAEAERRYVDALDAERSVREKKDKP